MATSHTSDFPAESSTQTERQNQNAKTKQKDMTYYKTKKIYFRGRSPHIVLQNENNGPCPLVAISNVLILRNAMNLETGHNRVSEETLMALVATTLNELNRNDEDYLKDLMSDAMNLVPCLANGLNVDIKFRRIDDFELTTERAIFDVLKIPLYHGFIADPEDIDTVGCKSYNELLTLEAQAQTVKARRGDTEEQLQICQTLLFSELEAKGFDTRRRSSSGDSLSRFTDDSFLDDSFLDDSFVDDSVGDESSCDSTPDSKICQKSKCDDVGNEGEEVCDVGTESTKIESISEDVTFHSPGESHLGQSSLEVIKNFLETNASHLTSTGISCLKEGLKEGELCVFLCKNHFSTMLKHKKRLYVLVTDERYLMQDLVWEQITESKGNSDYFMTGKFQVFSTDTANDELIHAYIDAENVEVPIEPEVLLTRIKAALSQLNIHNDICVHIVSGTRSRFGKKKARAYERCNLGEIKLVFLANETKQAVDRWIHNNLNELVKERIDEFDSFEMPTAGKTVVLGVGDSGYVGKIHLLRALGLRVLVMAPSIMTTGDAITRKGEWCRFKRAMEDEAVWFTGTVN